MKRIGGIVLAGGHSRRMGRPKATLPFGPELLLQRVVRIVSQSVETVIVVAAIDQSLPPLPPDVVVARDQHPDRGPLEGIAAGLRTLQQSCPQLDAAFITACDAPLLTSALVDRMIELLDAPHDAAVPLWDNVPQPLTGVYRTNVLPVVEALLAENRISVCDVFQQIRVRFIPAEQLRAVDPNLHSLRNLNTLGEYEAALAAAGFSDKHLFTH